MMTPKDTNPTVLEGGAECMCIYSKIAVAYETGYMKVCTTLIIIINNVDATKEALMFKCEDSINPEAPGYPHM